MGESGFTMSIMVAPRDDAGVGESAVTMSEYPLW